MKTLAPAARAKLLALVTLVATFAVGAVVGAAFDRALSARAVPTRADADRVGRRGDRPPGDIFEQLSLTPEQRRQLDDIFGRRRAEMEAFWATAGPRLDAIADSTRAEVRAVLTPSQRAEYDRLRAERRERERSRERGRRGGGEKEGGRP